MSSIPAQDAQFKRAERSVFKTILILYDPELIKKHLYHFPWIPCFETCMPVPRKWCGISYRRRQIVKRLCIELKKESRRIKDHVKQEKDFRIA
jgi:hypothetical protein